MEDEIKKRTALDILKKKFFLHHADQKSAVIPVYKDDFPVELEMNFMDIGNLLMSLEKETLEEIKVEAVANLETDLEFFLENKELVREQMIKRGSCYKVRYTPKEKRPEITTGAEYIEDKGFAYIVFSRARKVNLGKKNTRTAKLVHAFLSVDTSQLTVTKRKEVILSEIMINKDKNKNLDEFEKEKILTGTTKEINRKIHKKGINISLSIETSGSNFCKLIINED